MPRPPKKSRPPLSTKGRAVRLLSRREHSARELTRKLAQRGVDEDEARAAVADLAADGWQSDARYAESMLRQRLAQAYGPLRIVAELEAAGVPREHIDAALAAADCDWTEQCRAAHARRFEPPQTARDWQKQFAHLQGRGYTSEQIYAVLKSRPDAE